MTPSQAGADDLNPDAPWNQVDEVAIAMPCEDCQRETDVFPNDHYKGMTVLCEECEQKRETES